VQRGMTHGSETWLMKKENTTALQWSEMRMIRWMFDVAVLNRFSSNERQRLESNCQ